MAGKRASIAWIRGSIANTSPDRFRRTIIGHYIVGEAEQVARYYHPVLQMDGTEVALGINDAGGPCGVWTERDGERVVELAEPSAVAAGSAHV